MEYMSKPTTRPHAIKVPGGAELQGKLSGMTASVNGPSIREA